MLAPDAPVLIRVQREGNACPCRGTVWKETGPDTGHSESFTVDSNHKHTFYYTDSGQACLLLWWEMLSLSFKALCFTNILIKIVWESDRKCLCSQEVEKWKRATANCLPNKIWQKHDCSLDIVQLNYWVVWEGYYFYSLLGQFSKVASEGPEYLRRVGYFCILDWIAVVVSIQPNSPSSRPIDLPFSIQNNFCIKVPTALLHLFIGKIAVS